MIKRFLFLSLALTLSSLSFAQSLEQDLQKSLSHFFHNYKSTNVDIGRSKLEKFHLDKQSKTLTVYADERFAFQPFREQNTQAIYRHVKQIIPHSIRDYSITILAGGRKIEDLIPNYYRSSQLDYKRIHRPFDTKQVPWVTNMSRPYYASRGLEGRHIAVWQSHGYYFINNKNKWGWQRPHLFCTTEDQFTQSFVLPFLIPMLENAGAIVFTPRERDIQRQEVIVDNDIKTNSLYIEESKRNQKWERYDGAGFAASKTFYLDGENPFLRGTSRVVQTKKSKAKAFAQWVPTIPEDGRYAVYVSYQSTPQSVSDAQYLVFHKGGITEFSVNQKIGGGTWVYLGTFNFSKGNSPLGMVVLTNQSKEEGVVSADAVRFGGGMGNIMRGGSPSGLPRYLEGARYAAQWYGMPYEVYSGKKGTNDYIDDINVRSNVINYLSGGSFFNPKQAGLGVPLELNLALHSDAGYRRNDKIFGTLGIYTTQANANPLGTNMDRLSARDFTDLVLTQLEKDIQSNFDIQWTRRSMWDKNYSETRLPNIPSIIVELLSHQNFADMRMGHDPHFKFVVSRSIYKAILKYLSDQQKKNYVVQPLPVRNFSAILSGKNKVKLQWTPTEDPFEPSAQANSYIVYTRIGNDGFDNGVLVRNNEYQMTIEPGLIYSFKVAALNKGGESFPSETLVAYKAPKERAEALIVNGFNRLSGPKPIDTDIEAGFDLHADPGVPYIHDISLAGNQEYFRRTGAGKEGKQGLGYSTDELEGFTLAGNTFDYPYIHGKAIQATPGVSFSSASKAAVESGRVVLVNYSLVDLILGLEKEDDFNPHSNVHYKTFSPRLQEKITDYCNWGGRILISGSYLGSDMSRLTTDKHFTEHVLKYSLAYSIFNKDIQTISGLGPSFTIPRVVNEQTYAVTHPEVLNAEGEGFPVLVYPELKHAAAIAFDGSYKTFVMGFPFESINSQQSRAQLMASVLNFFLN